MGCLVVKFNHFKCLGDISRYQKRFNEAESLYFHAIEADPSNGHPFNQLAILSANRGDRLATAYYYHRSISTAVPFNLAATNLESFYDSLIPNSPLKGTESVSSSNIVISFLQMLAALPYLFEIRVDSFFKLISFIHLDELIS